MVKKEAPSPMLPKSRFHLLRSKVLASKKRKPVEVVDLELLDNMDSEGFIKKNPSLVQIALEKLSGNIEVSERKAKEAQERVEGMKKIVVAANSKPWKRVSKRSLALRRNLRTPRLNINKICKS